MKLSIDNLFKAIEQWVASDLIAKGSPLQQGLITFALLQGKDRVKTNLMPVLSMLTDEHHNFEYGTLNENLQKSLSKMGGNYLIPVVNYRFDRADLDKIMSYAKEYLTDENN